MAAFKPVVTGLDERAGRLAARPRAARRGGERRADARAGGALPLRPAGVAPLRGGAGRRDDRAARARRRGARRAASATLLVCEGVGGLLVPLTPGLPRARPRAGPRPAAGGGGAHRASARSTTRCSRSRPRAPPGSRGRRGDDAVARASPSRSRALEPRDGRAARRRAGERPAAHHAGAGSPRPAPRCRSTTGSKLADGAEQSSGRSARRPARAAEEAAGAQGPAQAAHIRSIVRAWWCSGPDRARRHRHVRPRGAGPRHRGDPRWASASSRSSSTAPSGCSSG